MSALDNLYKNNPVNEKRISTDVFFTADTDSKFTGFVDKNIKFIEDFQLLDPVCWARFVEQYKTHSDENGGWRGEYWGKMMRGACFTYSYTKNEKLYSILTDTVEDMMSAMDEYGRISTYTVENEFFSWDIWSRKYVLLGMQYFMEICRDEELKKRIVFSMEQQVNYLMSKIGPEEEKIRITETSMYWRGMASSSILEPVVRLYDITGRKEYLDFASYIVSEGGISLNGFDIFEEAYKDTTPPYQYPITKAYEMISCFEGLIEYYRATGIEKYKTAAYNFGKRLGETDITIIGSAGCTHEYFDHAALRQTDTAYEGIMQETCVTVTWMKFCWQLLMLTGDVRFADFFEQSLYNAYFGSINTEKIVDTELIRSRKDNRPGFPTWDEAIIEPMPFDSYSSLLPNTRGRGIGGLQMMQDKHYYGCCACIGSAGTGMIHKVATMLQKDGIVLNLFIPGTVKTVTPDGQNINIITDTEYPVSGKVKFMFELDNKENFAITLRVPEWSDETLLSVNGGEIPCKKGYNRIKRTWQNGDEIVLELDMRTKIISAPSDPVDVIFRKNDWMNSYVIPEVVYESEDAKYHIALRRGPIVLARDARLGENVDEETDILYDKNGYVNVTCSDKAKFEKVIELQIPQKNGKTFTVVDYGSAGKTWREDSKYACWLPTKR